MSDVQKVKNYYDEHIKGKLRGFVQENPRIERAWQTVSTFAPAEVTQILEVGCGIGDTCWRMSFQWPRANVVGLDISPKSIEIAKKLFGSDRISFVEGILTKDTLQAKFDLIVLMDVYEHIAQSDRHVLHEALASLISEKGHIILSFPTPRHLAYLREYVPGGIQPVDEDITVEVINQLAKDTSTEVKLYQEVAIWHPGDYAHAVLSRPDAKWTQESYKENNIALRSQNRLERVVRKLAFENPILSRKTQRIAFIRKKLGQHAY